MHETAPGRGLVGEHQLHRQLQQIYDSRGEAEPGAATRRFLDDLRNHAAGFSSVGRRQALNPRHDGAPAAWGGRPVRPTTGALATTLGLVLTAW